MDQKAGHRIRGICTGERTGKEMLILNGNLTGDMIRRVHLVELIGNLSESMYIHIQLSLLCS